MTEAETPAEQTKTRTHEEISTEYNRCCNRAGDLSYRIEVQKDELLALQKHMFALNQEAKELGAKAIPQPGLEAVK